jgi:transcriptional regulator with XRE-family HTH domain
MRTRRLTTIIDGRQMTQTDISRKLRVPQTTYSSWERGLTTPPPKHQKKLIKLLNLPKDYFEAPEEEVEDDE